MLFDDKEEAESDDEASETPAQRKKKSDEALKKRKLKEDQKTKNKKAKKDTEESEDEEDKEIEQAESEYLNRPDAGEGETKEAEESRCVLTRFFTKSLFLRSSYFCSSAISQFTSSALFAVMERSCFLIICSLTTYFDEKTNSELSKCFHPIGLFRRKTMTKNLFGVC